MRNIKALALTVQKLLARLKFSNDDRMNDEITDRTKTLCPPIFNLGGIMKKISKTEYIKNIQRFTDSMNFCVCIM